MNEEFVKELVVCYLTEQTSQETKDVLIKIGNYLGSLDIKESPEVGYALNALVRAYFRQDAESFEEYLKNQQIFIDSL